MAFSRKYLNDDEHVILDLHPHWWTFVKPSLAIVACFVAWIKSHDIAEATAGSARKLIETSALWLTLAALLLTVLWLAKVALTWSRTHFVLTNQRVIFRAGVRPTTAAVQMSRSIFGRSLPLLRRCRGS